MHGTGMGFGMGFGFGGIGMWIILIIGLLIIARARQISAEVIPPTISAGSCPLPSSNDASGDALRLLSTPR